MLHYFDTIQGWFPEEAQPLFKAIIARAPISLFGSLEPMRCVEVGVWKGMSTVFAAVEIENSGRQVEWYAVDHFRGSDEPAHKNDPELASLAEIFCRNVRPFPFVFPVDMDSLEASFELCPDKHFDFVFLDASHDFDSVLADILHWKRRLRHAGVIAGDDYHLASVRRAVDTAISDTHNIEVNGRVWVATGKHQPKLNCWRPKRG